MSGETNWSPYNVPQLSGIMNEDFTEAWDQVGAWFSAQAMLDDAVTNLQKARDGLAAVWPAESSPAAQKFFEIVDNLTDSMTQTSSASNTNGNALAQVLDNQDTTKTQVDGLHSAWQVYQRQSFGSPTDFPDPQAWHAGLNAQAQQHMAAADKVIDEYAAALVVPPIVPLPNLREPETIIPGTDGTLPSFGGSGGGSGSSGGVPSPSQPTGPGGGVVSPPSLPGLPILTGGGPPPVGGAGPGPGGGVVSPPSVPVSPGPGSPGTPIPVLPGPVVPGPGAPGRGTTAPGGSGGAGEPIPEPGLGGRGGVNVPGGESPGAPGSGLTGSVGAGAGGGAGEPPPGEMLIGRGGAGGAGTPGEPVPGAAGGASGEGGGFIGGAPIGGGGSAGGIGRGTVGSGRFGGSGTGGPFGESAAEDVSWRSGSVLGADGTLRPAPTRQVTGYLDGSAVAPTASAEPARVAGSSGAGEGMMPGMFGGAGGSGNRQTRRSLIESAWPMPSGGPAVLAPSYETDVHDPGPGVIGIDR